MIDRKQQSVFSYRYDGVDEDGQHWLEEIEIMPDGEERYTEKYVPIRLWEREKEIPK